MNFPKESKPAADLLNNRYWRLNNLYYIKNKEGKRVKFVMNESQEELYWSLEHMNVLLKARQKGFTTLIDIMILDMAVFNKDFDAVIIAHNKDDAKKIFRSKIKYPYDNLPEELRKAVRLEKDTDGEFLFSNGSSIQVSTSARSGTIQFLHVSEYGKVAATAPLKAEEIKTGAFEAVPKGGMIIVESTAEGTSGEFYDLCQMAGNNTPPYSEMEWKLHFHPWWTTREYAVDPKGVLIKPYLLKYFDSLKEKHGIHLTSDQKAWYAIKAATLGDKMKREYPSTEAEAFSTSLKGSFYNDEIQAARSEGRITAGLYRKGVPVETWWDIGHFDSTAIWFTQTIGRRVHVVHFEESPLDEDGKPISKGLPYFKRRLDKLMEERGFRYKAHHGPHDMNITEWGSAKSRYTLAQELGLKFEVSKRTAKLSDDVEVTRDFIHRCVFDEDFCSEGVTHLSNYRRKPNRETGGFLERPLHDGHSHAADAFRELAINHVFDNATPMQSTARPVKQVAWG